MFHRTAHVYDLIYAADGKDYARESQDIHELIQQRFPHASTLLDVACGTGGHLAYLQRHYDVVGVDADPAMLEQARTRLPGIQLVEADMRSFRLDRHFDAVTCLFSSIGYMTSMWRSRTWHATLTLAACSSSMPGSCPKSGRNRQHRHRHRRDRCSQGRPRRARHPRGHHHAP